LDSFFYFVHEMSACLVLTLDYSKIFIRNVAYSRLAWHFSYTVVMALAREMNGQRTAVKKGRSVVNGGVPCGVHGFFFL